MRATACDRILHQSRLRAWAPVFAGQQRQEPHRRPSALHTGFRGTPRAPEPRAVVRYWIGLRHTATELHRAPYRYLRYFSGGSSAVQLPPGPTSHPTGPDRQLQCRPNGTHITRHCRNRVHPAGIGIPAHTLQSLYRSPADATFRGCHEGSTAPGTIRVFHQRNTAPAKRTYSPFDPR